MKSLEEATENSPGRKPWDARRESDLVPPGAKEPSRAGLSFAPPGLELVAAANPGLTPWAILLRPCGARRNVFIYVLNVVIQ